MFPLVVPRRLRILTLRVAGRMDPKNILHFWSKPWTTRTFPDTEQCFPHSTQRRPT